MNDFFTQNFTSSIDFRYFQNYSSTENITNTSAQGNCNKISSEIQNNSKENLDDLNDKNKTVEDLIHNQNHCIKQHKNENEKHYDSIKQHHIGIDQHHNINTIHSSMRQHHGKTKRQYDCTKQHHNSTKQLQNRIEQHPGKTAKHHDTNESNENISQYYDEIKQHHNNIQQNHNSIRQHPDGNKHYEGSEQHHDSIKQHHDDSEHLPDCIKQNNGSEQHPHSIKQHPYIFKKLHNINNEPHNTSKVQQNKNKQHNNFKQQHCNTEQQYINIEQHHNNIEQQHNNFEQQHNSFEQDNNIKPQHGNIKKQQSNIQQQNNMEQQQNNFEEQHINVNLQQNIKQQHRNIKQQHNNTKEKPNKNEHHDSITHSPNYFLSKFIDADIIKILLTETIKVSKNSKNFTPIIEEELHCFIAINYLLGYLHLPRRRMLWERSPDTHTPLVANAMQRDRFETIYKALGSLNDQVLRQLTTSLNKKFNACVPVASQHTIGKVVYKNLEIWAGCCKNGYCTYFSTISGDLHVSRSIIFNYVRGNKMDEIIFKNDYSDENFLDEILRLGVKPCPVTLKRANCGTNQALGGLDKLANYLNLYTIPMSKAAKFSLQYFTFLFELVLCNAFSLYKVSLGDDKSLDLLGFRRNVAIYYLQHYAKPIGGNKGANFRKVRFVTSEARFDGLRHYVVPQKKQTRCGQCTAKTTTRCQKCDVGVHVKCFVEFHTKSKQNN